MSDVKDEFQRQIAEAAELDRKKKVLAAKELMLRERKVNNEIDRMAINDRDMEIAQSTDFGTMSQSQIDNIRKEGREYIEAAKNCMRFINESFDGVVPYFRKNLILVGGKTGEGKSTTVANIISSTMRETNPHTNKRRRVLVITNEEKSEDVYNRVTCLAKGWSYTNHDKFTSEQIETFDKYIYLLAKDGWLTVVDDSFGSTQETRVSGITTSIEGIQSVFDDLIKKEVLYDAVIIDYYQNIRFSKKNPQLNEWQVQAQLAAMLDQYKNIYPAPIIVMAQVSPPDKDNKTPFKARIEGRKVILNVCTACIEMIADRENRRTEWLIHKSRFNESVGNSFYTGYDKGRFVVHTPEFQIETERMKEIREAHKMDMQIGLKNVFKDGEKDGTDI